MNGPDESIAVRAIGVASKCLQLQRDAVFPVGVQIVISTGSGPAFDNGDQPDDQPVLEGQSFEELSAQIAD